MSESGRAEASRLLRSASWRRWEMTSFDEPEVEPEAPPVAPVDPGPSPEEILRELKEQAVAQGRQQGYAEGYAQGLEEGRLAGKAEGLAAGREEGLAEGIATARETGRQEALRLNAVAGASATAIGALEEKMGQSLLTLALDIARQVLGTTLAQQPESMLAAVREVLHINPASGGPLRLWVHPDDLELVRMHLAEELKEGDWRLLADESIARGGCRAETAFGDVDATLQTRWRRVAASLGRADAWEPTT